jgi:hypothetical protein
MEAAVGLSGWILLRSNDIYLGYVIAGEAYMINLGFKMGIPKVRFSHTVPEPMPGIYQY